MSQIAEVALVTARTLLDDDSGTLWSDTVLLPKLAQAHRELQSKMRKAACPVMFGTSTGIYVSAGSVTLSLPSDLLEPIKLWESTVSSYGPYTPMTESYNLAALTTLGGTLGYWEWFEENIVFLGSTNNEWVSVYYYRYLTVPTSGSNSIGILNGELYLAPRIAALAAGSVGEEKVLTYATQLANDSLDDVIKANKGRIIGIRP